ILKHIDVVKDETVRDNYAGQAKFLRAWAYFNLVRYFGAVPLVTEPFSNGDMTRTKDRDPVDLVYDFIVSELNESKTLMTAEFNSSTDYGRANKWAATALLGKVLLTRGEKAAALPLLRDVYENSGYELIPDYGALFSESEELTVAPREVLFSVRFTPGGLSTGSIVPTFAAKDVYHGYGRNVTLYSDNLLKAFTNTTDTLVDERFHVTCSNVPGYFEGPMDLGVLSRYPAKLVGLEKGSDNAYHSVLLPTDNDAGLDYPEIRFADVVLMLAECEGNTEEGIRLLNEVRARASAPLYDETAINTLFGGDFEEAVLNERRLELAFEGDRLFDLERMGNDYMEAKLLEFYNNEKVYTDEAHFFAIVQIVKQVTNNGASIDNWRFLLPIPRNQLVRSEVM
ncbi:MAG TPA: RagB/SusD family nutrient uptake outer membrane protein, partial [Chitinophagaceae bacterium]|nr:RagB/SusD family nutrient uptake outer membrane protein [Chitinophagaceae bacterium]